jgi:hypothetical protein
MDERFQAAFHEAGHSLAAYRLGRRLGDASVDRDGAGFARTFAIALHRRKTMLAPQWSAECVAEALICHAGPTAERQYAGGLKRGMLRAWRTDMEMVHEWLAKADSNVSVEQIAKRTQELLVEPRSWRAVNDIAAWLLLRGSLSGKVIERICREQNVPLVEGAI